MKEDGSIWKKEVNEDSWTRVNENYGNKVKISAGPDVVWGVNS